MTCSCCSGVSIRCPDGDARSGAGGDAVAPGGERVAPGGDAVSPGETPYDERRDDEPPPPPPRGVPPLPGVRLPGSTNRSEKRCGVVGGGAAAALGDGRGAADGDGRSGS